MYRMLVADDEQVVLDSMNFIIQSDFNGIIELHTVRTGREAIGKAEDIFFDIIFMDIKMPGINGIEASREIRERNSEVTIVFMTAYETFDFAKEAIQLGVREYLIKPVIKDSVVTLINQIIRQIQTTKGKRREQLSLWEKYHNILPVLENSFINALLLPDPGYNNLEKYRKLLDIDEDCGYIITVEHTDTESIDVFRSEKALGFKNEAVFKPVFESIKARYRCFLSPLTVRRLVIYVPSWDKENEYNQRIMAITIGEYIKRKITDLAGIYSLSIGIGRCYSGLENIVQSYEESFTAIRYNGESGLLHIMDMEQIDAKQRRYPIVIEKRMLRSISLGREDEAIQDFLTIYSWMEEEYGKELETFKAKFFELDVLLNRLLWDFSEKQDDFPIRTDDLRCIASVTLVSEMRTWFIRRIKAVINFIRTEKSTHDSTLIKTVKTYVLENYMNETSLGSVARVVNISPHYLSKLFKDETDISFIEYLTSIRMDKAKELLRCGCFSVKDICFRVGYTDPNYFSRVFRKLIGVSPTQYKEEEMGWELGSGVFIVPEQQKNTDNHNPCVRIGFSMASMYENRWQKDKESFVQKAKELDAEVFVKVADNNCEKQIQQVQSLLNKGVDVLVIIPQNSEKMAKPVADAKALGVKVVSYCRLIMNADIDMYIAYDGIRIGEMMAETIVDEVPEGKYLIVNGSQSDYNSQMYNQGIKNILQKYIANKAIEVIEEIWAYDWQPKDAMRGVENVLTRDTNIDAIICGNDTLAEAVIQVLTRYDLAGTIKVTGHDGDFSGFNNTLNGTQLMTVYTPFESLASQAAGFTVKMALGREISTHWSIFNGFKNVPYHKKQPIAVTRDNINDIMKVSGYSLVKKNS